MQFTDLGLAIIKSFEGCRLKGYPDPASGGAPFTIGYGHTGPEVHMGLTWTQEQADQRLADDVAVRAKVLEDFIGRSDLTDDQFSALLCFCYNVKNWRGTPMFSLVRQGKYAEAALHIPLYDMAAGKVMPGLVERRKCETLLFNGDHDGVQTILDART